MKLYLLEKQLWTEEDFGRMDWHDSQVYGIAFAGDHGEFSLDIDYLFEWVCPTPEMMTDGEMDLSFWLAPCTLTFEQVRDLKINLMVSSWITLQISQISRANPRQPLRSPYPGKKLEYDWLMVTQQGNISFTATSFRQYVRQRPILSDSQVMNLEKRGGIAFGTKIE